MANPVRSGRTGKLNWRVHVDSCEGGVVTGFYGASVPQEAYIDDPKTLCIISNDMLADYGWWSADRARSGKKVLKSFRTEAVTDVAKVHSQHPWMNRHPVFHPWMQFEHRFETPVVEATVETIDDGLAAAA